MRNIQQIICLLSKSELEFFSKPFLKTCLEAGFKVTHVPPDDSDAFRKAVLVMTEAEKNGQRVVIHCASGQKRTGDVLALWLHRRYCISVEKAVKEVADFAKGNFFYLLSILCVLMNTESHTYNMQHIA